MCEKCGHPNPTPEQREGRKKLLANVVYSLWCGNDMDGDGIFCALMFNTDGTPKASMFTPNLHDTVMSGKMREFVTANWEFGCGMLMVMLGKSAEDALHELKHVSELFPDIPMVDVCWTDGKYWAREADPTTVEAFDADVKDLDIVADTHQVLMQLVIDGRVYQTNFTNPGTKVKQSDIDAARDLHTRLSELTQPQRDAAARKFFMEVAMMKRLRVGTIADDMMRSFCGVYLSLSMSAVAHSMKRMKEEGNSEGAAWWTVIAVDGVQDYARPVYSVAGSGWDAADDINLAAECRSRGLNEDEMALLFAEFEKETTEGK